MVLVFALCAGCAEGRMPAPSRADDAAPRVVLHVGGTPLQARLARTDDERARGLSGVSHLPADEGMLFVYPQDARRRFWMKDCRIALDIAFLDATGRILQVDTLAPPTATGGTVAQTRRSPPSAYVLETNAGWLQARGLGVGTRVTIPASVVRSEAD